MNSFDFVYMSIYRGALREGAPEPIAKDAAVVGLEKYKKGTFEKASRLIEDQNKKAKADRKKEPA